MKLKSILYKNEQNEIIDKIINILNLDNEIKKLAPRNSKHQKDWNNWYEVIIAISYYNIYCQALVDGLSTNILIPERYMKLKQPNEKLFLNVIKKLGKKHKIIVI